MLNLFRPNREKRLRKEYDQLLQQGMQAQRNGDMQRYAELSVQSAEVLVKLQTLQNGKN